MTTRDLQMILGTLVEARTRLNETEPGRYPSYLDEPLTEAIGLLRTELAITERDRAAIVAKTAKGERA